MSKRIEPQIPLGEAVRMMRESQGLSKTTVASRGGISERWIEYVEDGKGNPSWANLRRLMLGLSVEPTELMAMVELAERGQLAPKPGGEGALDGSPGVTRWRSRLKTSNFRLGSLGRRLHVFRDRAGGGPEDCPE